MLLDDLEIFWYGFTMQVKLSNKLHLFDSLLTHEEETIINILFESDTSVLDEHNLYVWLLKRKSFSGFFHIFRIFSWLKREFTKKNVGKTWLVTDDGGLCSHSKDYIFMAIQY